MSDPSFGREGYLVMVEFLRAYSERAGAGSLATLLADVEIDVDGEPFDPAMWPDWLAALKVVRELPPDGAHSIPPKPAVP